LSDIKISFQFHFIITNKRYGAYILHEIFQFSNFQLKLKLHALFRLMIFSGQEGLGL